MVVQIVATNQISDKYTAKCNHLCCWIPGCFCNVMSMFCNCYDVLQHCFVTMFL